MNRDVGDYRGLLAALIVMCIFATRGRLLEAVCGTQSPSTWRALRLGRAPRLHSMASSSFGRMAGLSLHIAGRP